MYCTSVTVHYIESEPEISRINIVAIDVNFWGYFCILAIYLFICLFVYLFNYFFKRKRKRKRKSIKLNKNKSLKTNDRMESLWKYFTKADFGSAIELDWGEPDRAPH